MMTHPNIEFVIASAHEYVKRNEVKYGDKLSYSDKALMVKNLLDHIALLSASPPEQPAALSLAVRLRDESGPPLPQMIAQRRAQLSQEQPAATPDIVKMYSDMERAKNARIGELEEALGKAVLSAPLVRQLTENERDAIAHAKYQCDCSSPSDPEVRFDYEVIRTLLSLIPTERAET